MKSLLAITGMLVLLGSASAFAAELNIPMEFEYLALDEKKVLTNSFRHKSRLEFGQGTHKIAVRYQDMVKDDYGSDESLIKSAPLIITITVDGDHHYVLSPAEGKVIKNPKTFAKNPAVKISRSDNGPVSYQVVNTNWEEESFVSRLFSGNQEQDITGEAVTATGSGASLAETGAPAQTAAPVPVGKPGATSAALPTAATESERGNKSPGVNSQQMLQYWWTQADEKTRREFMGWVGSQP